MPSTIPSILNAVQAMHACQVEHLQSTLVHEQQDGVTVWNGQVEIFKLSGHDKADRAYAWVEKGEDGDIRYVVVLNEPPVSSPRKAVQTVLASSAAQ